MSSPKLYNPNIYEYRGWLFIWSPYETSFPINRDGTFRKTKSVPYLKDVIKFEREENKDSFIYVGRLATCLDTLN